jgi:hypothetical protein
MRWTRVSQIALVGMFATCNGETPTTCPAISQSHRTLKTKPSHIRVISPRTAVRVTRHLLYHHLLAIDLNHDSTQRRTVPSGMGATSRLWSISLWRFGVGSGVLHGIKLLHSCFLSCSKSALLISTLEGFRTAFKKNFFVWQRLFSICNKPKQAPNAV